MASGTTKEARPAADSNGELSQQQQVSMEAKRYICMYVCVESEQEDPRESWG